MECGSRLSYQLWLIPGFPAILWRGRYRRLFAYSFDLEFLA
ncbi:unnamed protein product [Pelagomonas calceolata]|uniref:Uncharacterized protein n=1 Tax=Pelagomonas calceolata TaxID=35677 RepID=A0A8J2SGV1_9STRA|nr:unnamed protein product [Pelagomonas calceolata]